MRAHLRYIQREGVSRQGEAGRLYDAATDDADGATFATRCADDRHQFRFIVAPEDGAELTDLKPFVRDLMRQMEADLGTRLEWVAADHFNTGHPHSHIVVRGKDDRGADLVIARDYIAHGVRARASELVTRELGPETDREILHKLEREVEAERLTRLDRAILQDARDGVLSLADCPEQDAVRHALRVGRLHLLERMGLATEEPAGTWRLAADVEQTLRRMGERGDIVKTMHRELRAAGVARAPGDYVIFDPDRPENRVVGRVVAEGFSDELNERRFVIVDGIDGRTHYAELGARRGDDEPLPRNTIVAVQPRDRSSDKIDRAIARVAALHAGAYSVDHHRQVDPGASGEYIATHVRRLEAMRRAGLVQREEDGIWQVGTDFADRAERFEIANRQRSPVRVSVLSWQDLQALPHAAGATWLDRQLVGKDSEIPAATGFGADVATALCNRRQWLLDRGLAQQRAGGVIYAANLLKTLERRELADVGARIAAETGLTHAEAKPGESIAGRYRRSLTLVSGRYALIERSQDFVLVPWRPVLERARGQSVVGVAGSAGISWSIGKTRGMEV